MENINDYRTFKKQQFQSFLDSLPIKNEQVEIIPTTIASVRIKFHYPKVEKEQYPVIFNFHGGGFVLGLYEQDDFYCQMLSNKSQSIVINVDYPLAPEHPFPEPTLAIVEVVQKILTKSDQYRINRQRVFLCGSSAGGNLALSCQEYFYQQYRQVFSGVICNYAVFDLNGLFKKTRYYPWYIKKYSEVFSPLASPIYSSVNYGQNLLIHVATLDPLYIEGVVYVKKLRQQGISVKLMEHKGVDHGFLHEIYQEYNKQAAQRAIEQTANFIIKSQSNRVVKYTPKKGTDSKI